MRQLRVLALCAFPVEAAATRFRLSQYVGPLRRRGIELTIKPFIDGRRFKDLYSPGGLALKALSMLTPVTKRFRDSLTAGRYDAILIQREAMLFGPGFFEWLTKAVGGVPMLLDLDDATYVDYVSPTYGRLGSFFKFFGKTDNLIRRSNIVICGNRFIAEYAKSKGSRTTVIPTVVDTDEFRPREHIPETDTLTLGWIGTHSTFPFLETLFPVLERLSEKHNFRLKIVGARRPDIKLRGVPVENLDWDLDREVDDFASLDIGLYPIVPKGAANDEWIKGKSGFKAIQYMAVGVPFVMSPVGVCSELGEPGRTHLNAASSEDWYNSLNTLLGDPELRTRMGVAARKHSLENYGVEVQADALAEVFRSVARK